ncbi:tRNA (adenosine(37)-N6)-dimethylallyltransferase MiaA [Paenibacillus sp. KN14-4R]|uniref:tRNA (adenosine(37)-N6)-dimethylallyltransferase MiaA n=1 Tax=Paenibacillus sp. KN14-4R TaxID=3445773 RepID=UPI003FA17049
MLTNIEPKPPLLVLVGPTAVGKTQLSLTLAEQYKCEIISGDSMQVYRGMDIGTAKVSMEERARVPHHMIDIHDPSDAFSVAEFQERVRDLIPQINNRGHLPFIVGGTGLYVESVCYNYQFSEANSDEQLRQELDTYAIEHGDQALHDMLREVDPASADRLHPNDRRRIIRAIEVFRVTGTKLSEQLAGQKKESPYNLCIVGLTMDRALLYKRIEERVDEMMQQGLLDEVKRLLAEGYDPYSVAMQGLGYKEMVGHLQGEYSLEGAIELLKRDTRRFAKRQLSWFRHMKDIHWVDVTEITNFSAHLANINDIITGKIVQ